MVMSQCKVMCAADGSYNLKFTKGTSWWVHSGEMRGTVKCVYPVPVPGSTGRRSVHFIPKKERYLTNCFPCLAEGQTTKHIFQIKLTQSCRQTSWKFSVNSTYTPTKQIKWEAPRPQILACPFISDGCDISHVLHGNLWLDCINLVFWTIHLKHHGHISLSLLATGKHECVWCSCLFPSY